MTLQFIEGGAGTGKTTTVVQRLGQVLAVTPLGEQQRVLALTKMHGSRRRVGDRLRRVVALRGRFESLTIDSFAWRLITRWRSLARILSTAELPTEFDERCELAGRLLEETQVQKWVAASFPIVVVDELQDSKGGQLRVLQGLSVRCHCIAAGDSFQDLDGDAQCASVEWARTQGVPTVLAVTHRTSNAGLLAAAAALRGGRPVAAAGGFGLKGVAVWGLGAYETASKIARWGRLGSIAVISPVGAMTSPFVRQVIERVNSGPLGKQWKVGPFKLPWEAASIQRVKDLCQELGLSEDDAASVRGEELVLVGDGPIGRVRSWIARQRRLFGRTEFVVAEVRKVVKETVEQGRAYSTQHERGLVALTVHQAKNREFDRVIVLWPYEVSGNDERKRRLAYNAITRAKQEAFVLVQGEARVGQPPFGSSGDGESSPLGRKRSRRG